MYNLRMEIKAKPWMELQPDAPAEIRRYRRGKWETNPANVIVESGLDLAVNGQHWLTFMCTPTHLAQLALGFLFNEEVIQTMDEVAAVDICDSGEQADVWLRHTAAKPESWRRTSGCSGGVTSVPDLSGKALEIKAGSIHPDTVLNMMGIFMGAQELYRRTRGVHSSALSDGEKLIFKAEDIGRHNTLDKLAGLLLESTEEMPTRYILTTGRISSEMLQKSARMKAPLVISRTAPNSMSIRMAEELGITLVGYARRDEFTVYAHTERLA